MPQNIRGNFRTDESLAHEFRHSCLGRLLILAAIVAVLLVIAAVTVPNSDTMRIETQDNIHQCLQANDSIKTDWIDDAVNNIGYIFTHADSIPDTETIQSYERYNTLKVYPHTFYSSALLHNNLHPEGARVGIGVFGVVIPTVIFSDILIRLGPMHKGYDQAPVQRTIIIGGESFGTNPELGL
jgi:hypothetical protein